jgi:hypothetical protein
MKYISAKSVLLPALLLLTAAAPAQETSIHKNEVTGLLTWTSAGEGFKIQLIQLIPDFVRAVYAKHHFPKQEVERVASYCVFGTILKNTSEQQLSYRVSDWRYQTKDGKQHPVKTKTQWLDEWRKAGITFSWTLLPDIGEFSVGDWQQGFTTIQLPRETSFDFIYKWQLDGVAHTGVIKNMRCAPDALAEAN